MLDAALRLTFEPRTGRLAGHCGVTTAVADRSKRLDTVRWTPYCITRAEAARGRFDTEFKALAEKVMAEPFISRGFRGRRKPGSIADRLPPGQYETGDFPVLSAGPTPH